MTLDFDTFECPIGKILLVTREDRLCSLDFSTHESRFEHLLRIRYPDAKLSPAADPGGVTTRVRRYFDGDFTAFDGLKVETGGTPFQQKVWTALLDIPVGDTWTYGQLAKYVGNPKGSRAVGHANSLNPVAIVVPCHRVIGSNHSLTGYGGGLERKRWLLAHECALFANGKVPDLQTVLAVDRG